MKFGNDKKITLCKIAKNDINNLSEITACTK